MPVYDVPHATYDEFKNAVIGHGYNMDGAYGYQCWDGVDLLYDQVGMVFLTGIQGYASEAWTNAISREANGQFPFSIVNGIQNIKRGDIVMLAANPPAVGTAGHCAFADSNYNGTNRLVLLGQNQGSGANPTTGTVFNLTEFNISSFLGIFRYTPWNSPTPPTGSSKKKHFPWAIAFEHWGYGKI